MSFPFHYIHSSSSCPLSFLMSLISSQIPYLFSPFLKFHQFPMWFLASFLASTLFTSFQLHYIHSASSCPHSFLMWFQLHYIHSNSSSLLSFLFIFSFHYVPLYLPNIPLESLCPFSFTLKNKGLTTIISARSCVITLSLLVCVWL